MLSKEDPRLRHARALFVLAAFLLVAGQLLPKSQYARGPGWTRWVDMGKDLAAVLKGRGDQRELLLDGLLVTSALLILSAPFLAGVFARSAALRWTARFLTAGTWGGWLYASNHPGYLTGGEHCILAALIFLVLGLARLPAQPSPAMALADQ